VQLLRISTSCEPMSRAEAAHSKLTLLPRVSVSIEGGRDSIRAGAPSPRRSLTIAVKRHRHHEGVIATTTVSIDLRRLMLWAVALSLIASSAAYTTAVVTDPEAANGRSDARELRELRGLDEAGEWRRRHGGAHSGGRGKSSSSGWWWRRATESAPTSDGALNANGRACDASQPAVGHWVPLPEPPYALPTSAFQRLKGKAIPDEKLAGSMAGPTCSLAKPSRPHFEWEAEGCELAPFERETACALLRSRGIRQVLIVGDSLSAQFFVSFTMLLEGEEGFGPPRPAEHKKLRGNMLFDAAASVCDDEVRVSLQRNDLLALSCSGLETGIFKACDGSILTAPWGTRAVHDADLVILGSGMHYPSLPLKIKNQSAPGLASEFFARNLNHTLTTLIAHRAVAELRNGSSHPSSIVVVGPPVPVPACNTFASPVHPAEALLASSESASKFAASWRDVHRLNAAARWLALRHGATFLDVSTFTQTRPDAAVGSYGRGSAKVVDCVHSCQPGPLDTWVRLLVHALRERPDTASPAQPEARWFLVPRSEWLEKGGCAFEQNYPGCHNTHRLPGPAPYYCISAAPWFPFGRCAQGGAAAVTIVAKQCEKRGGWF